MKLKFLLQIIIAIGILFLCGTSIAQNRPVIPPMPIAPAPVIDPATGQPVDQSMAGWKDPNWKDSDIVLTNINFADGLPLTEVIRYIRDSFHGQFDILTPANWGNNPYNPPPIDANTGQPLPMVGSSTVDLSAITITLQLKNVTASELFNAMNLDFENDRLPLRWELKLNGKRQIALLRVLADPSPQLVNPVVPPPIIRRVYFVGDLIGDEKNGGMTMDQLVQTVQEVWKTTYHESASLQFHKEAQLLIVSGTGDQIDFAQDLLNALKQKVFLGSTARSEKQALVQQQANLAALQALDAQQKAKDAAEKAAATQKTSNLKPSNK